MSDFRALLDKIAGLRALRNGWNYGSGNAVAKASAQNAVQLARMLQVIGIEEFDAFPGDTGSVMLAAYRGNESVEIQCFPNGTYDYQFEDANGPRAVLTDQSFGCILRNLEGDGWQSPRLFVSCTRSVLTRRNAGIIGLHSGMPQEAGFRWYPQIVSLNAGASPANTSDSFTRRTYAESRQSTGELRRANWRMELV